MLYIFFSLKTEYINQISQRKTIIIVTQKTGQYLSNNVLKRITTTVIELIIIH